MFTTFALTMGQLAAQAYRKLGFLPSGGVPSNDQMNQAITNFNMMQASLQADGINLWRQTQLNLAVGAMQGTPGNPLSVVPLIMGIEDGRWVVQPAPNLFQRPLAVYPYSYYWNLPNPLAGSTSGPSIIMFDRQATESNIYLWPPPSIPGTLNVTVGRTVNDVTSPSDTLDFPQEWTEGMVYMLADRLMEDEGLADAAGGQATAQRITEHSIAFYAKLLSFDRPTAVYIRPWGKAGQSPFWRG